MTCNNAQLHIVCMITLQTDDDTPLPWSARMAMRLLHQQAACSDIGPPGDALMCPWIDALPRQVP